MSPAALDIRTHAVVDRRWSGTPVEVGDGRARVDLVAGPETAADETGLVHGGFLFSLADHAAMLAVNDPTVVLAGAEVRFHAPAEVGDELVAAAAVEGVEGRRRRVRCTVSRGEVTLFTGEFLCVVPDRHVLAGRGEAG